MKTLREIKHILSENKEDLKNMYNVKQIGVFGSVIHGESNDESDVDILVEFEEPPGFFKYLDLEEHLCNLLGMKVDLVVGSALKPQIGKRILGEVEYV